MNATAPDLVETADYTPLQFKGNNLILRNIQTGELIEIATDEELLTSLNIDRKQLQELSAGVTQKCTEEETFEQRWTDEATFILINLYAKHEADWKSNKIKVDDVWKMISNKMKASNFNFTAIQAKNKWKHLRKLYFKQNESMGPTATGKSPYTFKFYDEMNNIYSDKPNVKPVALASSSKGSQLDVEMVKQSDNAEKKRKSDALEINNSKISKTAKHVIAWMSETTAKKEEKRQTHHNEKLEVQREAIKAFSEAMNKLIDKL